MPEESLQPFEAEVGRVLDLVIHSLYTEREIFLRELLSNAADACDRLRYAALAEPGLLGDAPTLCIEVAPDGGAGTLTVRDNGIGMDQDELAANLGTVARSGTARFAQALSGDAAKDVRLIGQFGVGFYAAFMVADEVTVISRKAGADAVWQWRSDGRSGFSVSEGPADAPRGTAVVLRLREDAREFLDGWRLQGLVRTYSDHVAVPILIKEPNKEPQQANAASALWTRPKNEINDEQYAEFYRHVAHAADEPFARVHFRAEGTLEYTALLFVPGARPFDLYDPHRQHGVKLYVKRVFISDSVEGLLPRYLRFVSGVVDSEDLPLNVSRETLQHSALVAKIRQTLVRRLLAELERKSKEESYDAFVDAFGAVLKEGLYEDAANREALLKLVRFRSTGADGWVSLADYVGRMKPGQDAIYTISGDSGQALRGSPQLEAANAKGVEVLLLTDPVDEFWPNVVGTFEGKPFTSLTRGDVDLSKIEGGIADRDEGAPPAQVATLIAVLKTHLGEAVKDVRASKRLTESAVCLIAEEGGMDLRLERFLQQHNQLDALSKRILEINPKHPLIARMAALASAGGKSAELGEIADLLLDQAQIAEGEPLRDPGAFARRMSAFLAKGLAA